MHNHIPESSDEYQNILLPAYASRALSESIPKYYLPNTSLPSDVAYRIISDELMIEGNAHMNLATFVTTWMEPIATQLMKETLEKNLIDKDEYPQSAEIEKRCVNIIARLWNAPKEASAIGTSTVGSSEACMLAGLALKTIWKNNRRVKNLAYDRPNLVLGINAQICWEKFCKYWDVEPRFVALEEGRYHIDPVLAAELCDENTIGVIGILGSTLDGSYEPINELCNQLDKLQLEKELDIPIHVDAASGGFVAPFLNPELIWDFRLLRVKSINASGHKYGLVYPGVGWVVWRHPADLPEELIFNVNYLGGDMPTFTLNFSRPGNAIIVQYYNFLRLGKEGYTRIHQSSLNTANYLANKIEETGQFIVLNQPNNLPVFAFKLKDSSHWNLFQLSDSLRKHGWQVPAYKLPKNLEETTVMRIVVKENLSRDMAEKLLTDLKKEMKTLSKITRHYSEDNSSFHH